MIPTPLLFAAIAGWLGPEKLQVVVEGTSGERRVELPGADAEWLDPGVWFQGADGALSVRFEGSEAVAPTGSAGRPVQVDLADGDVLDARLLGGEGEDLQILMVGGVRIDLSIDALRGLVLPSNARGAADFQPAPEGDRLYRRTAGGVDRLDGAVVGFTDRGVQFESLLGEQSIGWGEVLAIYVEVFDDLVETADEEGFPVSLDLVDGSRIHAGWRGVRSDSAKFAWRGSEVVLPLGAIAEVVAADGRVAFLSQYSPSQVDEGSPFGDDLGMVWLHRMDRAVDGAPLRAGGRTFTRGIGVHSPSSLTFSMRDLVPPGESAGAWTELRGLVALDDQVAELPALGSVVFRVHVDGDLRWTSPLMRGGDAPVAFPPIQLGGVERVELEVDMATDLHLGDRADWLRMLLIR